MRLFKKRPSDNRRSTESEQAWLEKMAGLIARMGIKVQKAFATCMNRVTGKLSLKGLKAALVLFCLFCGGISCYLIVSAIADSDGNSTPLTPGIQTPKLVGTDWENRVLKNRSADARVIGRIQAFRRYMDSLRKTGGSLYDSMRTDRPGLIDSLTLIDEWYDSQPLK